MRASVADRAGNVTEAYIDLPEGTGSPPDLAAMPQGFDDPPPLSLGISNGGGSEITAGPGFTPVTRGPAFVSRISSRGAAAKPRFARARPPAELQPGSKDGLSRTGTATRARAGLGSSERGGADRRRRTCFRRGRQRTSELEALPRPRGPRNERPDRTPRGRRTEPGRDASGREPEIQAAVRGRGRRSRAVRRLSSSGSPRTAAEPGSAAEATTDRVSPIEVDLGGEGTFGLCLVARSASGLGDQPPAPGDPPQSWVEVDSTAPVVQIQPPQIGTGVNAGKVAIAWRASDLHLPPRSVTLSWRPDQPGAQWQTIADGLDNAGQFIWNVPAGRLRTVPLEGRGDRFRGPPRLGRHNRIGPDHSRPQPPAQPHHRPGPERPLGHHGAERGRCGNTGQETDRARSIALKPPAPAAL